MIYTVKRGEDLDKTAGAENRPKVAFASYSAGTETKPQINQDAVRLMKEHYSIDMEAEGQHSKLLSDIPEDERYGHKSKNIDICPRKEKKLWAYKKRLLVASN